jgi:hypothetical protein
MEALGGAPTDEASGERLPAPDEAPEVSAQTALPVDRGGTADAPVAPPDDADAGSRPMLRLVRNTVRTLIGAPEAPPVAPSTLPEAPVSPSASPARSPHVPADVGEAAPTEHLAVHPRKGVCESYYVNHQCWEVADAFCNTALHTCMLRDCPVFNLNREELEKRFASKYSHLW